MKRSCKDAEGKRVEDGETGWIRFIHFDRMSFAITIEGEQGDLVGNLVLFNSPQSGDVPGREYLYEPEAAAVYPEDSSDEPAWYHAAGALEKQDRFLEAEECIRVAIPCAAYAFRVSNMSRERMLY